VGIDHEYADEAAAYALGALTPAERVNFEAHLAHCALCAAEVRSFAPIVGALANTIPTAEPPPAARDRLLAAIRSSPQRQIQSVEPASGGVIPLADSSTASSRRTAERAPTSDGMSRLGPYALAASMALAVALGGYAAQLRGRITTLEARLRDTVLRAETNERLVADARRSALESQRTILVLAAPDLARIDLAGQAAAPQASARAFWSRSRGLVFTASNLPTPPPGRAYQLWVLTAQPTPISAGMLKLDANGRATEMIDTPQDLPRPVAMAVTLEPEAGVPAPTGDKYLVGLAN
jgi:anti-sigma-K factor RskA